MYNLAISGPSDAREEAIKSFGEKYDFTDDFSQANVVAVYDEDTNHTGDVDHVCDTDPAGDVIKTILSSKLLFAVCDFTEGGLPDTYVRACSEKGVAVFRKSPERVCDFIENGNLIDSVNYPDIYLGPFGDDISRIVVMMKGIDDPILLSAMIFSGMDVRAVSGGLANMPADFGAKIADSLLTDNTGSADAPADNAEIADNTDTPEDILYGASLIALREPVTRIPHVDGVIKVRVLQDI